MQGFNKCILTSNPHIRPPGKPQDPKMPQSLEDAPPKKVFGGVRPLLGGGRPPKLGTKARKLTTAALVNTANAAVVKIIILIIINIRTFCAHKVLYTFCA